MRKEIEQHGRVATQVSPGGTVGPGGGPWRCSGGGRVKRRRPRVQRKDRGWRAAANWGRVHEAMAMRCEGG